MIRQRTLLACLVWLVLAPLADARHATGLPDPSRWEDAIRAYELADRTAPPPAGGIVFIGSSSILMWTTLADDFAGLPVVNRGFGGSQLPEVTAFVSRIVVPYAPRIVVVYCGANDIDAGRTAAQVAEDARALAAAIHTSLPRARIAFISIAGNPARWAQVETVRAANRMIAEWTTRDPRLAFIDVFPHMLGPDGRPKPDIFLADGLHMNAGGYAIWREVVAPYLRTNP
jgi:lysophospholipase L1-like esterase